MTSGNYSISDTELDTMVEEVTHLYPHCGEKILSGCLRSNGNHIQRQTIRDSLHRVDPSGVECRVRNVLHTRRYQVQSPSSLWHLDGYQINSVEDCSWSY